MLAWLYVVRRCAAGCAIAKEKTKNRKPTKKRLRRLWHVSIQNITRPSRHALMDYLQCSAQLLCHGDSFCLRLCSSIHALRHRDRPQGNGMLFTSRACKLHSRECNQQKLRNRATHVSQCKRERNRHSRAHERYTTVECARCDRE